MRKGALRITSKERCLVGQTREKILKGTLSGAATTFGSSPTLSDVGRRRLQDDAVDGAVESALRGADQGLFGAGL